MKTTMTLSEYLNEFTAVEIERILDLVNRTMNEMHECDVCGRTPLPKGHPHCKSCDSPLMIVQCDCGDWFCETGCAQNHVHQDGQRGRFVKRLRPLRDTSEYDA